MCSVDGCAQDPLTSGQYEGLCKMHRDRLRRTGSVGTAHKMYGQGISPGWVTQGGYREIFRNGRVYKEHRWVLGQFLGRELLASEDVHHVNGDKLDNRLENLELWSTSQPRGQRVEDKVQYALEILRLYAPSALSER